VKEAFDNNGISIPFPQTDMHLHVVNNEKAVAPAVVSALSGDDTGRPRGATGIGSGDYGADEPRDDDSDRG
jgi:small conductance mechanosensitive channel